MSNLIEITHENFEKETKGKTPIIIDFWAEWCMPCQMMKPVFEKLSSEYEGKLKFAKLDTEQYSDLAGKFEIRGIPSLLILKDGKEIDRIVGFNPEPALREKIDAILKKLN